MPPGVGSMDTKHKSKEFQMNHIITTLTKEFGMSKHWIGWIVVAIIGIVIGIATGDYGIIHK